jgi:hypothetical protein
MVVNYDIVQILFILTIIQFWWIAIWGIAYMGIDLLAGSSKIIEIFIYIFMLTFTIVVLHTNPTLLERL